MNYSGFIQDILDTRGRFACSEDRYKERHHIIPKCMGGADDKDNLIDLYGREHFIAHKLLAEENPNNGRLVYAWSCMAWAKNDNQERYQVTPEEYEEAKNAHREVFRLQTKEQWQDEAYRANFSQKISEYWQNENWKNAWLDTMRERRGDDGYRKNMSNAQKQRYIDDPDLCRISSELQKAVWENKEYKDKMVEGIRERAKDNVLRQRWSEAQKNNWADPEYAARYYKPVYCPELDEYFDYVKAAADKYHIAKADISKCCKGTHKHAGKHPITGEKLTWQYMENNC